MLGEEALAVDASLAKTLSRATTLFYQVLEALLASERVRLQTTDFSALFSNTVFIASLFT